MCLSAAFCLSLSACASGSKAANPSEWDISRSRWLIIYDDFLGEREEYGIEFLDSGKLANGDSKDPNPDDDSWTQDRRHVIISVNGGFTVFEGDLKNSRMMSGFAKNLNGRSWLWSAYRLVK
jgi:hypothetical protein